MGRHSELAAGRLAQRDPAHSPAPAADAPAWTRDVSGLPEHSNERLVGPCDTEVLDAPRAACQRARDARAALRQSALRVRTDLRGAAVRSRGCRVAGDRRVLRSGKWTNPPVLVLASGRAVRAVPVPLRRRCTGLRGVHDNALDAPD